MTIARDKLAFNAVLWIVLLTMPFWRNAIGGYTEPARRVGIHGPAATAPHLRPALTARLAWRHPDAARLGPHRRAPCAVVSYGRRLAAAATGDPTLLCRCASVEAAWRVVDPVLGSATPLYEYGPHPWGPAESAEVLAPPGGWHDPLPHEAPP